MSLRLYDNPASPFCRMVDVLLAELGIADHVDKIAVAGHPTDSGTMPVGLNPLGKIPVLEREDGPALYDSRVICRFLNDRFDGRHYPDARLWEVLTLEATATGIMDAAILMVYESRSRAEDKRDPAWLDGQWDKIARSLAAVEDRWISHLSGHFDAGVAATAIALDYLDFRLGDRDWRAGHAALAAWRGKLDRPSLAETMPRLP